MTIKLVVKVFLIGVVPFFVWGFNVFEKTALYSSLVDLEGAESAVVERFVTNFGAPKRLYVHRIDGDEFDHLWQLISDNTNVKLPDWTPEVISRLAVENGSVVTLFGGTKIVLIPESMPIVAAKHNPFLAENSVSPDNEYLFVCTTRDLREWAKKKRDNIRSLIDLGVALASVVLGFFLDYAWKPQDGEKHD